MQILMIVTSHASLGATGRSTGVWLEELTTPYYSFVDAGVNVQIASIAGGKVPVDPHSVKPAGENPASVDRFLKDAAAVRKLDHSLQVASLSADDYSAVFLPGGHGTMWDLPESAALARLLSRTWTSGKVVAAVCHGPAGLVNVEDAAGKPIVAGRRVSAFTNSEEEAIGLSKVVPFLLETRLRERGARFEGGPDFQAYAVRDGQLITGQNPASSEAVARLVLEEYRDSTGRQ